MRVREKVHTAAITLGLALGFFEILVVASLVVWYFTR